MKRKRKVEATIRDKLRFRAGVTLRDRMLTDVMNAQEQSREVTTTRREPGVGSRFILSPMVRFTSVAAAITVVAMCILLGGRFSRPVYALEQTIEALRNVRFLHIIRRDKTGQIEDERWIEIGADGRQAKYRQDNPLAQLISLWQTGTLGALDANDMQPLVPMAIEDGRMTAVYRYDKKAVIFYDRKDRQYQWVGLLGEAFENLLQEGKILQTDAKYRGRPAHRVWWPYLQCECYVDPETKLPMAMGDTELSYEPSPAGVFDIVIPQGYTVVDKRPDAGGQIPSWLLEEETAENQRLTKRNHFNEGAKALARGDYAKAVTLLEQAIGYDSWAPFWLGSAYYKLGQYESAIKSFAATIDLYREAAPSWDIPYCRYARGLAYAQSGDLAAAKADFQACLPVMIRVLRNPSEGYIFEYAEDPWIRFGQQEPGQQETLVKMVNRLRLITGQNFGYDPGGTAEQKQAAIAAWEQWLRNNGSIQFTPDAKLIPVPAIASQKH